VTAVLGGQSGMGAQSCREKSAWTSRDAGAHSISSTIEKWTLGWNVVRTIRSLERTMGAPTGWRNTVPSCGKIV